ncbi:MAG TPA: bifunctional UDP-N-acetylglucosamine diphosphorylase/glucosamine-1-phosphate N-acetyltransferase GlmU [Candidatus Nitrosotenuis sp.]|nr:bifunctional UDP-N-acetylglucosamine diphosphorylase/glucosamine-1-phosphate N-acetyltransferase GlmU [Candidatus Nitrosotenuis sp.]
MSSPSKLAAVILAAGKGTRMKSARAKVMHEVLGRPMLAYSLEAARHLAPDKILVVVGHGADEVRAAFAGQASFVEQTPPRGTGHAVSVALEQLAGFEGTVLILCGDMPLLTGEALGQLLERHRARGAALTCLTARVEHPGDFGRLVRAADGRVERIVEARDATAEELALREVNLGTYCAEAGVLHQVLPLLSSDNRQGEFYLTDAVALCHRHGHLVEALVTEDLELSLGINSRADLARATAALRRRILERWMLEGVTVLDPASTWVEPDVQIGVDTVLLPGTMLCGSTRVGQNCRVGPHSRLLDCTLEDEVQVQYSVLQEVYVGRGSTVGPFAHLRPGTRVGPRVRLGNFVETKNTILEEGCKVPHLSYVGDAQVGPRVNVGAGTITCNYDGHQKHRTVLEEGAFIGSNTSLVAPVRVGRGARTGAGAVVTRDVPPETLVVGVPARPLKSVSGPEGPGTRLQARLAGAPENVLGLEDSSGEARKVTRD